MSLSGGVSYQVSFEARLGRDSHQWEEGGVVTAGETVQHMVQAPAEAHLGDLADDYVTELAAKVSLLDAAGSVVARFVAPPAFVVWRDGVAVVLDDATAAREAPLGVVDAEVRAQYERAGAIEWIEAPVEPEPLAADVVVVGGEP